MNRLNDYEIALLIQTLEREQESGRLTRKSYEEHEILIDKLMQEQKERK